MKNIRNYILESDGELTNALVDLAWSVIDFFMQEGVQKFDEQDWKKYVKDDKDLDYEMITKAMVYSAHRYPKFPELEKELDKYPDTDLKEDIESAIIDAANGYLKGVQ